MKISNLNNISFGKKLIANASVIKDTGIPLRCNIFELENSDCDYFERVERNKDWSYNSYLHEADYDLNSPSPNEKFYVIENKNKKCLGYIVTDYDEDTKRKEVLLLETCPTYKSANGERGVKYIGETLMSFIVQLAEKENIPFVSIPIISSKAKNFYMANCGFEKDNTEVGALIMQQNNYDRVISKNLEHTGEFITFV